MGSLLSNARPAERSTVKLRYMSGRELEGRRTAREAQLAWITVQVARGELVIRQATAEERVRHGIGTERSPSEPRRPRRRRVESAAQHEL
jgi:hypothetical protein